MIPGERRREACTIAERFGSVELHARLSLLTQGEAQVSRVVLIPVENGAHHLHVEADDSRFGLHQEPTKIDQSLDESIEGLLPGLHVIAQKLRTLEPEKCTLTVAVKLTASAGAVLTKLGGEADFTVTLEWDKAQASSAQETGHTSGAARDAASS
jgi:hypothetical protein